jgi:2-C-methyl-D-erythritol 4-phosphate cytidylyltransferase
LAVGALKAFVNLCGRLMLEHALGGLWDSGVVDGGGGRPAEPHRRGKLVFGGDAVIVAGEQTAPSRPARAGGGW